MRQRRIAPTRPQHARRANPGLPRVPRTLALLMTLAGLTACSGDGDRATTSATTPPAATTSAPVATTAAPTTLATMPTLTAEDMDVENPELRDELLLMQAQDQFERTGEGLPDGAPLPQIDDVGRTERLREILAEYGWPTWDLVGPTAESSAWLIAQHSDHDVAFQEQALALLTTAYDAGQASGGNVAYLTDRIAANRQQPQTYGTQIGCVDGEPELAFPLTDPDNVDTLRAEAGLGTLAEYFDELRPICAEEDTGG